MEELYKKIGNHEKLVNFFGEFPSFHDAKVIDVKYDGSTAVISIDCAGFIKTMRLFDENYNNIDKGIIDLVFKDVVEFKIDGGYGFIDYFSLELNNNLFDAQIESCGLKIVCKNIEIGETTLFATKDSLNNKRLDDFLKSNK
jgi:hypothetical protein